MSEVINILMKEHENILKIAELLEKKCDEIENDKKTNKEFFEKVIDFIRNYADKFHHAKEEDILFKELNKAEGLHCNPIEQMLYEHNQGREFVKGMENGLKKDNKTKIIENARSYSNLIREHIFKEDNILYPMADEVLNEKIQKTMERKFKDAKIKKFRRGEKEKYLSIIKELKQKM